MTATACPHSHDGQTASSQSFVKQFDSCPSDPATNLPSAEALQRPTNRIAEGLPNERDASTIPRADSSNNETWMYPSSRMFYNALLRKGLDTPPESIDSMVQVHNFLNEQVWQEILQWEAMHRSICGGSKLKRFQGRPDDLSPRARFCGWFYGSPRPFDRHDWTVDRCGREVRYIIDYYSGPREEEATFFVDVRPALDSWDAVLDRSKTFWAEKRAVWLDKISSFLGK